MEREVSVYLPPLVATIIHFGTGLCLLLAISDLTRNSKATSAFWLAICLGSIQLRFGLYADGSLERYPRLIFLFITGLFAVGPLTMALADSLVEYPFVKRLPLWAHLTPASVALVGEVVLSVLLSNDDLRHLIGLVIAGRNFNWVFWVLTAGCVHQLFYLTYIVFGYSQVRTHYDSDFTRMLVTSMFIPTSTVILCLAGMIVGQPYLYFFGAALYSLAAGLLVVFALKRPDLLDRLRAEIRQKKYMHSQLDRLDVGAVQARLDELMGIKRMYEDDQLTLNKLAADVGVSYKQLSELLNGVYGKNFSSFVNEHRVARAKELLAEGQQMPVLDIAFAVGFNSKATFNAQFKKLTGCTPSEYRKSL